MEADCTIVLLAPAADDDAARRELDAAAAAEAAKLRSFASGTMSVRVATRLDEGPDLRGEWTAVLEIHGDRAAITRALAGLAGRLGGAVDAAQSGLVVGRDRTVFERTIPPGLTPAKMYYAMFRRAEMDAAAFAMAWWEGHAPLVERSPYQLTYHQLHGDEVATAGACDAAGLGVHDIAGVAHEDFPDAAALAAAATDDALADERNDVVLFADVQRSRGLLTTPIVG